MHPSYQKLLSYVSEIKHLNHSSAAAVVVMQNDQIILEHYEGVHGNEHSNLIGIDSMFNIASARKSYLALAIGYALYEKKIHSLDDCVSKYLKNYDQQIFQGTTIRHLMTHSHGLDERDDGSIYREFAAGESWAYRGINIRIITELFKYLYDYDFTQLLKERVFMPLGFKSTEWSTEESEALVKVIDYPEQKATFQLYPYDDGMGSNLHTTAREFALWGNLHLNMGRHEGIQVVPEDVIRLCTSIQSLQYDDGRLPANGLFWYVQEKAKERSEIGECVPKGSYQILGNTGPLLLVVPENHLVVVRMYNKRYNYGGKNYLHYLREFSNRASDAFTIPSCSKMHRL
ncbi:penicillin-binding protein [Exiguobacterium sp. KRL4]|uniref:serine hydrolase domain-containing protein n=1 Tax=Exiguobacterium sp. KRL4 TaxID=1914536 RepID=UPI0008F8812E|nr:serine hydrolase domain-containing protein [Exiguobacterium sp. KRL4]OIN66582.1 penicillin-binding protein [Exiguobacterium sp. KRL4]